MEELRILEKINEHSQKTELKQMTHWCWLDPFWICGGGGIQQWKFDGIVKYRVKSSNRHNGLIANELKESRKARAW